MTYIASFQGLTIDGNAPSTADETYFDPGSESEARFAYRNDGTTTWSKTGGTPTRLGSVLQGTTTDRNSGFYKSGTGWASQNRIELEESSVTPGNTGHFKATFKGNPEASNFYREDFRPVADGAAWMSGGTAPTYIYCDMRPLWTTCFNWNIIDVNGNGYRWGNAPNAPSNRTTDIPKLSGGSVVSIPDGFYSCLDPDVQYRRLELLSEMGVNHIMMWFDGHGTPSDLGNITMIGQIRNNPEFAHMRYCFFAEINTTTPAFPFDYLYSFTSDGFYAKWDNKPMLPTFGLASQSDSRFIMHSMGAFSSGNNPTWLWETAWPIYGENPIRNGAAFIIPRYDDRKTGEMPHGRASTQYYNKNLDGTMFADQFNAAKTAWNNRTIRAFGIQTFDEPHERIGYLMPHDDISVDGATPGTPGSDPYYLYDIAQGYFNQLRG